MGDVCVSIARAFYTLYVMHVGMEDVTMLSGRVHGLCRFFI